MTRWKREDEAAPTRSHRRGPARGTAREAAAASGPGATLLPLQATAGNRAVSTLVAAGGPQQRPAAVQRVWSLTGGKTYFDDATDSTYDAQTHTLTGPPAWTPVKQNGTQHEQLMARINADIAGAQGAVDVQPEGGQIDFDEVRRILRTYHNDGDEMPAKRWKAMRDELCAAVVMNNKSHKAHGANFNSPQRAIQQIKDWAVPLPETVKTALRPLINDQFGAYAF